MKDSRGFEIFGYVVCFLFALCTGDVRWVIAAALFNIATVV